MLLTLNDVIVMFIDVNDIYRRILRGVTHGPKVADKLPEI